MLYGLYLLSHTLKVIVWDSLNLKHAFKQIFTAVGLIPVTLIFSKSIGDGDGEYKNNSYVPTFHLILLSIDLQMAKEQTL